MIDQLVLFQRLYDLYVYMHKTVSQFPKSQRFILSVNLLQINFQMIRLTIIANSKKERETEQQELSVQLDLFRVYVRLAKDVGFLPIRKYGFVMEKINEISKMLNAWIKYTKTSSSSPQ